MTRHLFTPKDISRAKEARRKAAATQADGMETVHDGAIAAQPYLEATQERLAGIPPRFRGAYRLAMTGRSMRAAISAFCRECVGWEGIPESVRGCTAHACPLYPYRPYCKTPASPGPAAATAARRHGKQFLAPKAMPEANEPLEALTEQKG